MANYGAWVNSWVIRDKSYFCNPAKSMLPATFSVTKFVTKSCENVGIFVETDSFKKSIEKPPQHLENTAFP